MCLIDINDLITFILDADIRIQHRRCEEILRNCDYFDDVGGVLTKENAERILAACIVNKKIEPIVERALYFSDDKTITNSLFEKIKHYPRHKTRRNFLIALGHCPISMYQQQYICSLKVCTESFANLLQIYLTNSCFKRNDLQNLVSCNMEFLSSVDLSAILLDYTIDEDKINYIRMLTQINLT